MDPQFVQNLNHLLQQCSVPDTNVVKQATAALEPIFKDPKSVPALFQILSESPEVSVRQLAAVELRKRVAKGSGKAWTNQAPETRDAIKAKLLEIVSTESVALVRHGISRIISEIAKRELPAQSWPQLLPFLFQAANSNESSHRYVAIFTFFTLLEVFVEGDALSQHLPTILGVFSKSIQDPESLEVRVTTVRALGKIIQSLEDDAAADIQAMQTAVPQMVAVLNQCIEETNSEGVNHIVDVFENVAMCEVPVLNQYFAELIDFFLTKGGDKNIEEDIRHSCLNSLIWLCQYKRSKIQSLNLSKPIITKLMPIATEEDPEDADEDSPSRLSLRIIDTLATELPPSHVFPPLHEQMQQYMGSSDPTHRKAAMMAFGVSVEGCSEYIRPHMNQLWPFIESGLQDSEVLVRKAACVALGCLCEMLDDECAAKHATLLPMIMNLINDEKTQRAACTGLDSLLEVMNEEQISQYLPALMERLSGLLETAPVPVKATVTGAIGSAAHASKAAFTPYFQQTMQRIQPFLLLTGEGDETDLRGITIDTVGTFAVAVGAEAFRPYFEDLMKLAFNALELPNPRLRECSFIFFSTMSRVFGEEFGQFLGVVVPELIKSCQQSEHDPVPGAPGDGTVNGHAGEFEVDDDGYVDIEEINESFLNVNSAIAIEKEVAADALGEIFIHTRQAFVPFLESSVKELVQMLDHFYQGIRKSAVTSLFACINTCNSLSNPQPWEKGALVVPLNAEVRQLVDHIIPAILAAWESEDDRTAAIEICTSLAECLNKNGPAIISPHHQEAVCQNTIAVLEGQSYAQMDNDADAEGAEIESSEYETVLISGAMDLVGAMATTLGADFVEPLKQFLPLIAKFYAPTRSASERGAAVGSLGEIITGMKDSITPFTNDILSVLSRALSDEDVTVRSNAAFASGVLVENSSNDLSPHFNALLAAMQSLFQKGNEESTETKTARDNASGCLARLIMKNSNAVPIDQALPILFGAMPLEEDMLEWVPILSSLMFLIQSSNQVALSHLDTILQLFAHALGLEDALEGEFRGQTVAFISGLNVQHSDKIQANGLSQYLV